MLQVEAIFIPRKTLKKEGFPSPQNECLLSKVEKALAAHAKS